MKSRPLGRQGVVVGDEVKIVGDVSGDEGSLARIVEVAPAAHGPAAHGRRRRPDRAGRRGQRRPAGGRHRARRPPAAARARRPMPRRGLRRRHGPGRLPHEGRPRSRPTMSRACSSHSTCAPSSPAATATSTSCAPSCATGPACSSGTAASASRRWSTLLVPDADRTTSHVNAVTGRGRHTSTSAMVLPLPGGGWIIDTPGFRSFGLAHVEVRHVIAAFPDIAEVCADCPRGCTHAATEPECALDVAVADGRLRPSASSRCAASSPAATRRRTGYCPSSRPSRRGSRRLRAPAPRCRPTRPMTRTARRRR